MNPIILADNRLLDGTPAATDTATGYDVLNLRDLRTYTAWKAASSGTKYLTVDCATAKASDALAIVRHNLGTVSASVSVESSSDNSSWTERLAPFQPADDKPLLKLFAAATARYWRVKIVTATLAAQIAVCLLGGRITFPYPPESPYTPEQVRVEAESTRSKAGHLLGTTVRYKAIALRPSWRMLSRTFIDTSIVPFWELYGSNMAPFIFAWDTDAYPDLVHFVKLTDGYSFETPVSLGNYYDSFRLEMEGIKE